MTPRRRRATGIPGLSRDHIAILEVLIDARDRMTEAGLPPGEIAKRARKHFSRASPQFFMALAEMLRRRWLVRLPLGHQQVFYFPTPVGEQVYASWTFLARAASGKAGMLVAVTASRTTRPNGKGSTLRSWITEAGSSSPGSASASRASR